MVFTRVRTGFWTQFAMIFFGFHPFGCQNVQQGTSQPQYMDGDRYPPVSFDMAILMIFLAINLIEVIDEELQGDFPCIFHDFPKKTYHFSRFEVLLDDLLPLAKRAQDPWLQSLARTPSGSYEKWWFCSDLPGKNCGFL